MPAFEEGELGLVNGDSSLGQRSSLMPNEIEGRSFEIIRELLPDLTASDREMPILLRVVHTTGDPGIVEHIRIHPAAVESGLGAIRSGTRILVDVKMVAAGVNKGLAQKFGCAVSCAIDEPDVIAFAQQNKCTRASAAMRSFGAQLDGSIVVIGNAPTALFALIDLMDIEGRRPALVIGTPVGFVGAAESKAELMKRDVPYITVKGTRGGSAISAAIVNALLKLEA